MQVDSESPMSSPLKAARPGRLQMPSTLILPGPIPALDKVPPSPAPFVGYSNVPFSPMSPVPLTPSLSSSSGRRIPFESFEATTPMRECAPPLPSTTLTPAGLDMSRTIDSSRLMKKSFSAGPRTLSPISTGHHVSTVTAPLTPPLTPPCHSAQQLAQAPSQATPSSTRAPAPTMSSKLLADMDLHPDFESQYGIEEELGSGGFGFVVRATRFYDGQSVAVKFIDKRKIPSHGWVKTRSWGVAPGLRPAFPDSTRLVPMEAYVLRSVRHPGVVAYMDLFEDDAYFYLVMEHHGSPWTAHTPKEKDNMTSPSDLPALAAMTSAPFSDATAAPLTRQQSLSPPRPAPMLRRSSCDLFECIEQHSRFNESTARYIFAQVVDVVHALNQNGVCHRDIKDENIVVSSDFKVKLIDFGSAVIFDSKQAPPFYNRFFGTTSFASAEILRGEPYQAAPAEVWSLGVLLSILLTGECPFPDAAAAKIGRFSTTRARMPVLVEDLMKRCLEVDLDKRITVREMRRHPWLRSYFYAPS